MSPVTDSRTPTPLPQPVIYFLVSEQSFLSCQLANVYQSSLARTLYRCATHYTPLAHCLRTKSDRRRVSCFSLSTVIPGNLIWLQGGTDDNARRTLHSCMAMKHSEPYFPIRACRRRRSSVNFRGGARHFCPKKCMKNYQNTRIFMIFARKINKIPEFYMIFARKMPEFYIIIGRKIFFPIFWGGRHVPSLPRPPSLLRLWCLPRAM